jgi:hypothetical protein
MLLSPAPALAVARGIIEFGIRVTQLALEHHASAVFPSWIEPLASRTFRWEVHPKSPFQSTLAC